MVREPFCVVSCAGTFLIANLKAVIASQVTPRGPLPEPGFLEASEAGAGRQMKGLPGLLCSEQTAVARCSCGSKRIGKTQAYEERSAAKDTADGHGSQLCIAHSLPFPMEGDSRNTLP